MTWVAIEVNTAPESRVRLGAWLVEQTGHAIEERDDGTLVAYAGTTPDAFRDHVKGKALAISQITGGADVLYHASGTTGHGVFEAARELNLMANRLAHGLAEHWPGRVLKIGEA